MSKIALSSSFELLWKGDIQMKLVCVMGKIYLFNRMDGNEKSKNNL